MTTDQLPLAAFLLCKGGRLAALEPDTDQPALMVRFRVEGLGGTFHTDALIRAFIGGTAHVEPLAYYRALRQLKNEIAYYRHQHTKNNRSDKHDDHGGGPETVRG